MNCTQRQLMLIVILILTVTNLILISSLFSPLYNYNINNEYSGSFINMSLITVNNTQLVTKHKTVNTTEQFDKVKADIWINDYDQVDQVSSSLKNKSAGSVKLFSKKFDFIVLVLEHTYQSLLRARTDHFNETYWNNHGVNIKIYFVEGQYKYPEDIHTTDFGDIIKIDMPEERPNLVHKVIQGIKYIENVHKDEYEYILKTDIDVFNNFTEWKRIIMRTAEIHSYIIKYIGCMCHYHHMNADIRPKDMLYCSGMGYVVHNSVTQLLINFPKEKYLVAEDKTIGYILHKNKVSYHYNLYNTVIKNILKESGQTIWCKHLYTWFKAAKMFRDLAGNSVTI